MGTEAGTHIGAIAGRGARDLRLLFLTVGTSLRFVVPTVTLWYISWLVILEAEGAT